MESKHAFLGDESDFLDHRLDKRKRSTEQTLLREVMLEAELRDAAAEDVEHDWHRLRFVLKKEKGRSQHLIHAAQAAVLLVIVGGAYWMLPETQIPSDSANMESMRMRGKASIELYALDIPQEAERMASRMEGLGLQVTRKIAKDKAELDVKLTYPLAPAFVELLRTEEIPVPISGDLHLVYLPKASF